MEIRMRLAFGLIGTVLLGWCSQVQAQKIYANWNAFDDFYVNVAATGGAGDFPQSTWQSLAGQYPYLTGLTTPNAWSYAGGNFNGGPFPSSVGTYVSGGGLLSLTSGGTYAGPGASYSLGGADFLIGYNDNYGKAGLPNAQSVIGKYTKEWFPGSPNYTANTGGVNNKYLWLQGTGLSSSSDGLGAVLTWTAPSAGTYSFSGSYANGNYGQSTSFAIVDSGGNVLLSKQTLSASSTNSSYSFSRTYAAGDVVQFQVGTPAGGQGSPLGLEVKVNQTLAALSTTSGTPSSSTSFVLSGDNMSAGILVTPPNGFEVSTDNSTFSPTVTVGSSGAISTTRVYVRLKSSAAVGTYSGNIVLSSSNATSANVATTASTVAPAPTISNTRSAFDDFYVNVAATGGDGNFRQTDWINNAGIFPYDTGLITPNAWSYAGGNFNGVGAPSAVGTYVSGDNFMSLTSGGNFAGPGASYLLGGSDYLIGYNDQYGIAGLPNAQTVIGKYTKEWFPGSPNYTANTGGVNNKYLWLQGTGLSSSSDGLGAVLTWTAPSAGTYSFSGSYANGNYGQSTSFAIVDSGGNVLLSKQTLSASSANSSYSFSRTYNAGDVVQFQVGTPAGGQGSPLGLEVNVSQAPAALSTTYGTASSATSFFVAGANLLQGILVTPPNGFEVSTDNSTFSPTVTVGSSGTVNGTTVYLRLKATAPAGNYSGNIVLSSSNSTSVNVATTASTVSKATPTITAAPTASAITYGQALSSSTLSGGEGSVPGSFAFTSPNATPDASVAASQQVTFTPDDTTNYNTVSTNISVTVNKATPTISAAPTASSITYGQTLASSTLSGGSASVAGSFAFTSPTYAPGVGTASQGVTFAPTDTANYTAATTSVSVTVNPASLGSGDITLSPVGNGSYTASATGVSGFSYSYAGRNTNGITTTYGPTASAPSAAGYYTVTATSSDSNYTGSKSANYSIAGPVPVADSLVIPTGNSTFGIPLASLLQNDRRIDVSGNVQSDNLSISGVTGASVSGVMANYTVSGSGAQGFSYTLADASAGQSATGTVTLTPQSERSPFSLSGTPGTPAYDGFMTTVTVTFSGTAYQTYYLYYKGNLPDAVWKSVGGVYSENGTFSVDISEEGNHVSDWGTSMFFQGVK